MYMFCIPFNQPCDFFARCVVVHFPLSILSNTGKCDATVTVSGACSQRLARCVQTLTQLGHVRGSLTVNPFS